MNQVTHERARAFLHEGRQRLRAQEQIELDSHLASCAECRGYAAHLAAVEPALTRAMRARWDEARPPAGPSFRNWPSAGARSAPVRTWLVGLILTGGLTLLVATILAGPGLFEHLGLVAFPTATMPTLTTSIIAISPSSILPATMTPVATSAVPAAPPSPVPSSEPPATSSSRAPIRAILLSLSADQKTNIARPVDPENMADLPSYPPINLQYFAYPNALSPDGRLWAAVAWPGDPIIGGGILHLIDTYAWRDIPTSVVMSDSVHNLAFSPDGSRVVVTELWDRIGGGREIRGGDLRIVNVNQPDSVQTVPFDLYSQQLAFSADSRQLFIYGTPWPNCGSFSCFAAGAPRVMAFDLATGKSLWTLTLTGVKDGEYHEPTTDYRQLVNYYMPGLAFSRDGRRLYVVHADESQLTTVDLNNGSARTTAIAQPVSWLDQLMSLTAATAYAKGGPTGGTDKYAVLSVDETRLYVTGWQRQVQPDIFAPEGYKSIPIALQPQVIDPVTSSRLPQPEKALAGETGLELIPSPDGHWLYLNRPSDPSGNGTPDPTLAGLTILDTTTLKPIAQLEKGVTDMIVTFAPDGNLAYLEIPDRQSGSVTHLQVIRASSGQPVATRDIVGFGQVVVLPH